MIEQFIKALELEIIALKEGKGGNIVHIYNGELLRQSSNIFFYRFMLENFLVTLDDTPAALEIDHQEYDCSIVSAQNQQVEVVVHEKLPNFIPSAKLRTNSWFLLELLKKLYENNLGDEARFKNSYKFFSGANSNIDDSPKSAAYSKQGQQLNLSQQNAIENSLNNFLSVIWGPPGTGKTATIARLIESHINLGRTVLLLSHSNNAVDQALIKVAEQMKDTHYKEGRLVRLGIPKAEMLERIEANNPFVLLDRIADLKSNELATERNGIADSLEKFSRKRQVYSRVVFVHQSIFQLDQKLNELADNVTSLKKIYEYSKIEISQGEERVSELQSKLKIANESGFMKRIFQGLDPIKIEKNLKMVMQENDSKLLEIKTHEENIGKLNNQLIPLKEQKEKFSSELSFLLSENNISISDASKFLESYDEITKPLIVRLREVEKKIEEIKNHIIQESKLVATTLVKSYVSLEMESREFDVLVVDESSMAPLPMLFWAASKIKKGLTIVGDFKQLPPICVSKDEIVKMWLGRSIFDHLGISEIQKAKKKVCLLDLQYRMNPQISNIVNELFYDHCLKDDISTKNKIFADSISGATSICLVDTTDHNPWCSQLAEGGRFNLFSALVCVSLANKIIEGSQKQTSIGIITPYRNQSRLILKIAEDKGIEKKVRVNTIHSFQGGEENIVIFDFVEGLGAKSWYMLNEFDNKDSANLLLNVALTRAEAKLYIVANADFHSQRIPSNTTLVKIIDYFKASGKVIKSTEIIADLREENFNQWVSRLASLNGRPENFATSYNDKEFWPAFYNDLSRAQKEVVIFSPFLTADRLSKLMAVIEELLSRQVKIFVITLSPKQQPTIMKDAKDVIIKLKKIGVVVKYRTSMHEKIAIIDQNLRVPLSSFPNNLFIDGKHA